MDEQLSYDELCHYGKKGMKWGVRNTRIVKAHKKRKQKKQLANAREVKKQKAMTKAELDAKKKKVLESNDAKTIYQNRHLLSNEELTKAYIRLNTEANIKKLVPPKEKNKFEKAIDGYNKWGKKVTDVANTTLNAYKTVNNISKTLGLKSGPTQNTNGSNTNRNSSSGTGQQSSTTRTNTQRQSRRQRREELQRQEDFERWMQDYFDRPAGIGTTADSGSRRRRRRRS